MPKVTFVRDFDYRVPRKPSVVAYVRGWSGSVPKAHADAAREAGALVEASAPAGEGAPS